MGLCLSGCATVTMPSVGQQGYQVEDDERRLYKRSDELCEAIDQSGAIYNNSKLEEYLTQLANSLLSEGVKKDGLTISVKVLNDPSLNAFSLPNGHIYIHTGMLAMMDNQTQLATLLGHEMTHIINRHTLKQFRSLTNKSAFLSVIDVPLAIAGGQLAAVFTELATVSSIYGYSKSLEYEADENSFVMLTQNGYDLNEAKKLFEHLKEFIIDEDVKNPFFFSTHPNVNGRIANCNVLIAKNKNYSATKDIDSPAFDEFMQDVKIKDIGLCLEQGLFKTGEKIIDRFIAQHPQDYQGYFYRGELFRQRQDAPKGEKKRDKEKDYITALQGYSKTVELNPKFASTYQSRARVLQKLNRMEEAKTDLHKYLELKPAASNRAYIEQFLSQSKP